MIIQWTYDDLAQLYGYLTGEGDVINYSATRVVVAAVASVARPYTHIRSYQKVLPNPIRTGDRDLIQAMEQVRKALKIIYDEIDKLQ